MVSDVFREDRNVTLRGNEFILMRVYPSEYTVKMRVRDRL